MNRIDVYTPEITKGVPKKILDLFFDEKLNLENISFIIKTRPNFYKIKCTLDYKNVRDATLSRQIFSSCILCQKRTALNNLLTVITKPSLRKQIDLLHSIVPYKKFSCFRFSHFVYLNGVVSLCSLDCEEVLFNELTLFLVSNS